MDEWGAAAVSAGVVAVLAALARFYELRYKLQGQQTQAETDAKAKERKEEAAEERKNRRDIIAEQSEMIDSMKEEREESRQLIHDLRADLQKITVRLAVCETELRACQRDHEAQRGLNDVMMDALREAGVKVLLPGGSKIHPAMPPRPKAPEGGQQ